MPDPGQFALFFAAALLLAATPGPGIFYVAARSLASGRAEGIVSFLKVVFNKLPKSSSVTRAAYIHHIRASPCARLQPSLAKRRLLHTTLGRIAVECGRAKREDSTPIAEANFEK